jgi:uncharacterized protein YciI
MFLLLNDYIADAAEIEKVHAEHGAWFADQITRGKVVIAGRRVPPDGGVVLLNVDTRAEAEAFAAGDPYTIAGVAKYTVFEFNLARSYPDRLPEVRG